MVHDHELVDGLERRQVHGEDLGVDDAQEVTVEDDLHMPLRDGSDHHADLGLDLGDVGNVGADPAASQSIQNEY